MTRTFQPYGIVCAQKRKMGGKSTFGEWQMVHYEQHKWYSWRETGLMNKHCHLYWYSMKTNLLTQCVCWLISFPSKYKLFHYDFIIKYWEAGHIFFFFYSSCHWPSIILLYYSCVLKIIIEERRQKKPGRNWEGVNFKQLLNNEQSCH